MKALFKLVVALILAFALWFAWAALLPVKPSEIKFVLFASRLEHADTSRASCSAKELFAVRLRFSYCITSKALTR